MLSCSKKLTEVIVLTTDEAMIYHQKYQSKADEDYDCDDWEAYVPGPDDEVRIIRVCFQVMNSVSGEHNFSEEEGGEYMWYMMDNANMRLRKNPRMSLPVGNNTPNLHPKYQYRKVVLTDQPGDRGVYFHYDDDLFYFVNQGKDRNNYKKEVIHKYAMYRDSVLNIFMMPHHPDSVASKTYTPHGSGIAIGPSCKIAGIYEVGLEAWAAAPLLNHEIGHVFSLNHAWTRNDGCDDTPQHSNCFGAGPPPCDKGYSNNMMDYNNEQMAITPCQLGRIHRRMSTLKTMQRKLLVKTWCDYNAEKSVYIDTDSTWYGAKDMHGDIYVAEGTTFRIKCRVHLPSGANIIVEPGGHLVLDDAHIHNDCDDLWDGIQLQSLGNQKGKISILGDTRIENAVNTLQ